MKLFAAYLPQYHETDVNNRFWGKGYTDWVAVKNSKPLFEGHIQPKEPLEGYYDLSDIATLKWQAELAKKYRVDGFNIYHYWFKDGVQALETPAELLLNNSDINIEYFFSWDNCSWVRSWSNVEGNDWAPQYEKADIKDTGCMLEFAYGEEKDWIKHFEYLLKFFKDKRYLKIDNKPVFFFMKEGGTELVNMIKCWNKLAMENGFDGVYVISQATLLRKHETFDAEFLYQPLFSGWRLRKIIMSKLKISKNHKKTLILDYNRVWRNIIRTSKNRVKKNTILGSFVMYDDTPRRGEGAVIVKNASPKSFEHYFSKLYSLGVKNNQSLMLITAWNEWGEGAYLEPDVTSKYEYLEAIKETVEKNEL